MTLRRLAGLQRSRTRRRDWCACSRPAARRSAAGRGAALAVARPPPRPAAPASSARRWLFASPRRDRLVERQRQRRGAGRRARRATRARGQLRRSTEHGRVDRRCTQHFTGPSRGALVARAIRSMNTSSSDAGDRPRCRAADAARARAPSVTARRRLVGSRPIEAHVRALAEQLHVARRRARRRAARAAAAASSAITSSSWPAQRAPAASPARSSASSRPSCSSATRRSAPLRRDTASP